MVGTRSLSSGRAFARTRWLCPPYIHFPDQTSVQPKLGDVTGIRLELAFLHARDEVGQHRVGAAGEADLLAFAHHKPVHELDLGPPALLHVLAHGRALLTCDALAVLEALLVARLHHRLIALAGAGDRLRRQVQDLLELIPARLPDPDRLAPEPGGEAADRLVLQHLAAG